LVAAICAGGKLLSGAGNFSIVYAAEAYDLARKALSPCISMSLDRSENWSAMA